MRKTRINISLFYLFTFLGIGGLFPLLTVYLRDVVHLSGTQIGMIMSLIPIVTIFAQPLWGMICDYTQKSQLILTVTILTSGLTALPFLFTESYLVLLLLAALLAFFNSANVPISDSITLSFVQKYGGMYGNYRLWGAVGFAAAAFIMGELSERLGLAVIFYGFASLYVMAAFFAWRMPQESQSFKVNLRQGMTRLIKLPRFVLFLAAAVAIFGPVLANNSYFGLLVTDLGGSIAGVGLAFLFAAGSEAPFMRAAGMWIQKMGTLNIVILAAIVSCSRWIFYFFEPSIPLVYATTIAQGVSVGLYIPAALQFVRDTAPEEVRATAVAIYSAVGNGIGNWFCTFIGGILLEKFTIFTTYLFFGFLTSIGILLLLIVRRLEAAKEYQLRTS